MKHFIGKKVLSVLLVPTVFLVSACPAFAAEPSTGKEEVVYVNLGNDGVVKEINVVNILSPNSKNEIIDYGKYQSVRNMTTTDKVDYSGDTVEIDTSAEKLYYEGKLDSTVMPWDIQIRYYLDGKEYSAEEIAGKSGALKITINIAKNKDCDKSFYDSYALQASLSLDTDKCKNINASDATVANVGSNKQLTYTILPGKGADIEITADVTDFEMDGISINGVLLNLNVEVDEEELMDQITELIDAINKLDDGASELHSGVKDLQDGAKSELKNGVNDLQDGAEKLYSGTSDLKDGGSGLKNGAAELQNGAASLDDGVNSLNNGLGKIQEALNTLNQQSPELVNGSDSFKAALIQLQGALSGVSVEAQDLTALTDASSAIKSGIDDLVNGITNLQSSVSFEAYKSAMVQNGLDIDELRQKNDTAISNLQGMISSLSSQIEELKKAGADTSDLEAQATQLSNIVALLSANNASIKGTEAYLSTVNSGLTSLLQGATKLQINYAAFDGKIGELVDKLSGLFYQMSELSSAVNTLVTEYGKLDNGISAYTDAVAKIVASYSQAADGAAQLVAGSDALKTGSKNLYSGTGELLSGIVEIYNGTGDLKDGTGTLDDGVAELLTGIEQLYDGSGELQDGTSEMKEETSGMDTEINDKIDELLETIKGGDAETTSFVSTKNTDVDSVQFVIKTDSIQIPKEETTENEAPKKLTFWQKFLRLFGLYHED